MIGRLCLRFSCWLALVGLLAACRFENPLAAPTVTALPPTSPVTVAETVAVDEIAAFWELIGRAEALLPSERQQPVDRYVAQLTASPITVGKQVIFLWRGAADHVRLVGDMNNWLPEEALDLQRLSGSDLWYLPAVYEPDARLDYLYWIDGREMALDPLNPRQINTPTGPRSVLAMPEYEAPPELQAGTAVAAAASSGEMRTHTLESQALGQTRTFLVYVPAGQLVGQKAPTVYINNGSDFINLIDAPGLLDRLIAARQIPPLVAVFIPPIEATGEYLFNDSYIRFLADELAPFVQDLYGTDPSPSRSGLLGVDLGGLAAIRGVLNRPDVFGLAGGLSGVYALDSGNLYQQVEVSPAGARPPAVYLTVGTYETAVQLDGRSLDLAASADQLAGALGANGYRVLYEPRPEGHSWGLWQAAFGRALAYLYN